MSKDKFKPGDRVIGLEGWNDEGIGTVIKRLEDDTSNKGETVQVYLVKWDH